MYIGAHKTLYTCRATKVVHHIYKYQTDVHVAFYMWISIYKATCTSVWYMYTCIYACVCLYVRVSSSIAPASI